MLANHDQNIESRLSRFRLAQSVIFCKIRIEWLQKLLDKICKAWSIETCANLIFYKIANSAQAQ